MDKGETTAQQIFDGSATLEIPYYQRAYSWNRPELEDFLTDLINQTQTPKSYFLGTFLFHKAGKSGAFEKFYIVDGQQRITTLVIFINELLNMLKNEISPEDLQEYTRRYINNGNSSKLRLASSNHDDTFFTQYILAENKPSDIDTPSKRRLLEAKNYFKQELSKLPHTTLEKLLTEAESSKVLSHIVEGNAEATQIFELVNDRGKKLSDLEAIKSFIMYSICLCTKNHDSDLKVIQDNFSEIYKIMENLENKRNGNSILAYYTIANEDSILAYHTIAFEDNAKNNDKPKEYIKQKITKLLKDEKPNKETGEKKDTIEFITEYSRRLKDTFHYYKEMLENKHELDSFYYFVMVNRLANFLPLLIKSYKLDCSPQKNEFNKICHVCEKLAFCLKVAAFRVDALGADLHALSKNFKGDFKEIIEKLKLVIKDNDHNIVGRFEERMKANDFYNPRSPDTRKYFYFRYENHLRLQKPPRHGKLLPRHFHSRDSTTQLSIEHIMAQASKDIENDVNFKRDYLHKSGNLVIDNKSSNSHKGKISTEDKQPIYKESSFQSQQEISETSGEIDWKNIEQVQEYITERTDKLFDFAKKTWLDVDQF